MSPRGIPGSKSDHGTVNRYGNHGCRCQDCRRAWAAWNMAYRHRSGRSKPLAVEHARRYIEAWARPCGSETKYKLGCRCDECREASAAARRRRRARIAA